MFEWDWAGAEREFQTLSADPRLFLGNQYHPVALFLWARGRPDDAVAVMDRALRVDPENLESRIMRGDFLAHAGRLDDAVREYSAIIAAEPASARALFGLAEVYKRLGNMKGAIGELRKAYVATGEDYGTQALATVRTEDDYEKAEIVVARARLAALEAEAKQRYISPLDLARRYAQVGDREQAFAGLERAFTEKSAGLVLLKVDPAWDRVRDDPRFAALVRRVGIP
jgi:tetratricopeptide (TPR) repeat protein